MTRSTIAGVTVTADLMRPSGNGAPGEVVRIALWLRDAIKRSLGLAARPADRGAGDASTRLLASFRTQRPDARADSCQASVNNQVPVDPQRVLRHLHGRVCAG